MNDWRVMGIDDDWMLDRLNKSTGKGWLVPYFNNDAYSVRELYEQSSQLMAGWFCIALGMIEKVHALNHKRRMSWEEIIEGLKEKYYWLELKVIE